PSNHHEETIMKRYLSVSAIAAALFMLPAFAGAQPANDDGGDWRARHAERRAKMLERFDTNRDGQLDEAERAAMWQAKLDAKFARLDANGDGVISRAEFNDGMKHRRDGHRKGHWRGKRGYRGAHAE